LVVTIAAMMMMMMIGLVNLEVSWVLLLVLLVAARA
jgi:hypothetical protein